MQTLNTIIYSTIAGAATIVGILFVDKFQRKVTQKTIVFVSFAAGVLLSAAFLNILPEALDLNADALIYVLITILFLYLLEQRIAFHTCHDEQCDFHQSISVMGIFGLGFHSLLDGIIIGVGFEASNTLGLITTFGVLMHEFPEGVSIFSLLTHANYERRKKYFYSFLVALATPVGAILTLFFVKEIDFSILGILLSIAAGSFIYIGASDLIPETHRKLNPMNTPMVIAGAAIIYLANLFI